VGRVVTEFDISKIWQWFLVGNAIGTFVLTMLLLYLGTKFTKRSEHTELQARVALVEREIVAIDKRLTRGDMQFQSLEKSIAALPTREQLGELKTLVAVVEGHARVVEEQGKHARELFRQLDNKINVIEQYIRGMAQ